MPEVRTFCRICAATCGIIVTVEDGPGEPRVTHVAGDRDHPASQGYTCVKGRALPAFHHHPRRLEHPVVRHSGEPSGRELAWPDLLDDLAAGIGKVVDERGPDGVAIYLGTASAFDTAGRQGSEQLLKGLGSRQKYTSLTVDAIAKIFVADLVGGWSGLNPMWDEEQCGLLLLIGANPVVSHGHTYSMSNPRSRLRTQAARGELWVSDPRRTESAELATGHLACRPGSDYAMLAFLVRELLVEGADQDYLERHATGVPELMDAVEPYDLARAAADTGVDPQLLLRLLAGVRRAGRISVLTGTGVDMSAAGNSIEWMAWALAIVTGSYDRPGGMWFNPGFLARFDTHPHRVSPPEGRSFPGPRSRPDLLTRYGERPSAALVPEIEAGNIGALIVMGGNPAVCLPDSARTRAAFASLEVLAVADVVDNEMVQLATHVLPCAGQLERADLPYYSDTYQREVLSHYGPAAVPPAADRRPLWWSLAHLGRRLGVEMLPGLDLDTATDEDVLAPVLDASIDGPALRSAPTAVVHSGPVFGWVTEDVLPANRWRVAPPVLVAQLRELALKPRPALVITTRRILRVMNTQFRDLATTREPIGPPDVLINPVDAIANGIQDGARITITSAAGSTDGRARFSVDIVPGAVAMSHGWNGPNACALTSIDDDLDPLTGMVLQSGVPITLRPVTARS